jgi:hypothetical protein
VSSSIGKALGGLLVLELSTLQVSSLEKNLLGIGKDLASESLEQSLGWIGVVNQLDCVLMKVGRQIFQLCSNLCRRNSNCSRRACFLAFILKNFDDKGEQAVGRVLFLKKKIK